MLKNIKIKMNIEKVKVLEQLQELTGSMKFMINVILKKQQQKNSVIGQKNNVY